MAEEFHVSECSSKSLEEELNRLGGEGWLVVNCWPTDPGRAKIVMMREKEVFFKAQGGGFQTSRPLSQLTLEVPTARCLKEPLSPKVKNREFRLTTLATEFGSDEAGGLDCLRTLGLESPPKDSEKPRRFIGQTGIAVRQDARANWWPNAKKFVPGDSAKPPGAKSLLEGKAGATADTQTVPPPSDFSIHVAIELYLKKRTLGWAMPMVFYSRRWPNSSGFPF